MRRRRFRNPRGKSGGSVLAVLVPWALAGGLLYLMAQNASKVKSSSAAAPSGSGRAVPAASCCFGVTNTCGWG
jgi:hypothetical protein